MKAIPRGRIYHTLWQSALYSLQTLFSELENQKIIELFEIHMADYCNQKFGVCFPKARTAVFYYLKSLKLEAGSKILMPPITIKGMLDVVINLGLTPIYLDLDRNTLLPSLVDVEEIVAAHDIRAALLTPLFGIGSNIKEIGNCLRNNGINVIIDFSQCMNCEYEGNKINTYGDISVYSASSIKTIDTLGGGVLLTNEETVYVKMKESQQRLRSCSRIELLKKALQNLLRNFLTSRVVFDLITWKLLNLYRGINPEATLRMTGTRSTNPIVRLPNHWFCKYTSLQAKIGIEQIKKVKREDKKRVEIAMRIRRAIDKYVPNTSPNSKSVYWQLVLYTSNTETMQKHLKRSNIDCCATSLSLISSLDNYPNRTKLPIAEQIYYSSLFVPCYPSLAKSDTDAIIESLKAFYKVTI